MADPVPLYSGEAVLLSWGESHRDGRVVRFKIEEDGTHPFKGLETGVNGGQRFMLVAVPLNNDNSPAKPVSESKESGDRNPKPNSTRAVMMAKDSQFWEYLVLERGWTCQDEATADSVIKSTCRVKSKSDLNDGDGAARFEALRASFNSWRRTTGR